MLQEFDLNMELWREYDFGGRVYRIELPLTLYYRAGGTTHRVLGSDGVVHCLPVPGAHGCVLRWANHDPGRRSKQISVDPPINHMHLFLGYIHMLYDVLFGMFRARNDRPTFAGKCRDHPCHCIMSEEHLWVRQEHGIV